MKSSWNGSRFMAVYRSAQHSEVQIKVQNDAIRKYAHDHDMTKVGELMLEGFGHGLSDSIVDQILRQKAEGLDFSVLLLNEPARLARCHVDAVQILNRLKASNLVVIAVSTGSAVSGVLPE